jgi:hypothetical protein
MLQSRQFHVTMPESAASRQVSYDGSSVTVPLGK